MVPELLQRTVKILIFQGEDTAIPLDMEGLEGVEAEWLNLGLGG